MKKRRSSSPSVHDEPWKSAPVEQFEPQPPLAKNIRKPDHADQAENSVWDDPGLSHELAGDTPDDAVTWLRWYQFRSQQTSSMLTWGVTFLIACVSGLYAILGAFIVPVGLDYPIISAVVAAPISEELLKIALAVYVCEKRPWLYSSRFQILLCGLMSGLVFAAVENVLYLSVYIPHPTDGLIQWRWTICVALHVVCSTVASVGVAKVWRQFQLESRMPRLADGAAWIVAAIVIHGLYNFAAAITESLQYRF